MADLKTSLGEANDIELSTIPAADATAVTKPAPQDAAPVTVENKVTTNKLSATLEVDYDKVAVTDEVTNESLNRNAETLKASINLALDDMQTGINSVLQDLEGDYAEQTQELNNKFQTLVGAVNAGFSDVRTKAVTQTDDILAIINAKVGSVMGEVTKVLAVAENSQAKIAAIDETYSTDSEFAARVAKVDELINKLAGTDFSFLEALDAALDELNAMARIRFKEVSVNTASGNYSFDLAAEGWNAFASADDYRVEALSELDYHKQTRISSKTEASFTVGVVSKDVHFLPQPIDCSTSPVKVLVRVTNSNKNPLGFSTTRLTGADGSTETSTVGQ